MGIDRSTFVIDAEGDVANVMRGVNAAEHADDVLGALACLALSSYVAGLREVALARLREVFHFFATRS